MKRLRRNRALRHLQKLPALTKSEICDELLPFVGPLGVTFAENEIRFRSSLCLEQRAILASAYCEGLYSESIRYADIIGMDVSGNKLDVLLRSGHIFHFVKGRPVWLVENSLHFGEPLILRVLWWGFSGWVTGLWWCVTRRHTPPQRE